MDDEVVASGNLPLEAILIQRRLYDQEKRPNLRLKDEAVIRNGPQCYRVAKHVEVLDHRTRQLHHHSVTIDTFQRNKSNWTLQVPRQLTLTDEDDDEISALHTFLGVVRNDLPTETGNYLVIPVDHGVRKASVRDLLGAISVEEHAEVLAQALAIAGGDPDRLWELAAAAAENPDASTSAAAALNLARFTGALEQLKQLIAADEREGAFQAHLARYPWMFGSEYSELLERRTWTRDEQQDFMLRRTVDGYIELIEIKTPLGGRALFRHDESHDAHFAGPELSRVTGQVMKYLERLDADRLRIKAMDGEDPNKIRAKIIIGQDGDAAQQEALRRYNGHQNRIEVITFDQLVRIGQRVLDHLQQVIEPFDASVDATSAFDDTPF